MLLAVTISAFAPTAFGNEASQFVVSGFTANTEHWIDILSLCISSPTQPLSYPANTLFFVSSGWGFAPWSEATPRERQGFMSEATRFTFLIDGQIQKQSRVYQYFQQAQGLVPSDTMAKLFNTEYDQGLTGSHLFSAEYYLDGSLSGGEFGDLVLTLKFQCNVNFLD